MNAPSQETVNCLFDRFHKELSVDACVSVDMLNALMRNNNIVAIVVKNNGVKYHFLFPKTGLSWQGIWETIEQTIQKHNENP